MSTQRSLPRLVELWMEGAVTEAEAEASASDMDERQQRELHGLLADEVNRAVALMNIIEFKLSLRRNAAYRGKAWKPGDN